MSAGTVGRHMPPVITLDDLTAMMAADEHHRYEISPEGAEVGARVAAHHRATPLRGKRV